MFIRRTMRFRLPRADAAPAAPRAASRSPRLHGRCRCRPVAGAPRSPSDHAASGRRAAEAAARADACCRRSRSWRTSPSSPACSCTSCETPIGAYLAVARDRDPQDLVTAAEMRATATAQLAEIERKLQSLPAELDGAEGAGRSRTSRPSRRASRRRRHSNASGSSSRRAAKSTMRLRVARRRADGARRAARRAGRRRANQAHDHADDQLRLVDRYTAQLREAR